MRTRYGYDVNRPRRHEIVTHVRGNIVLLSDDHAQKQTAGRLLERGDGGLAHLIPPTIDLRPDPFAQVEDAGEVEPVFARAL